MLQQAFSGNVGKQWMNEHLDSHKLPSSEAKGR
jgi:hypothetical protein